MTKYLKITGDKTEREVRSLGESHLSTGGVKVDVLDSPPTVVRLR